MKKFQNMLTVSLLLICPLLVLLVISINSNYLIKIGVQMLISILLVISVACIIYSLIMLKKQKKFYLWFKIVFPICVVGCCSFLFLMYGPINVFRNWLITTAMNTMNHQYYCKWFYNDEQIENVMKNNYTQEIIEEPDMNLIHFDRVPNYANEYEEKLYKGHKKDEVYRIIRFKVNDCNAYLAAVYDPSRISVAVTKKYPNAGQYVTKMAEDQKAVLAINGGGFSDPNYSGAGGLPMGVAISNKKIYTGQNDNSRVIGFNDKNQLVLNASQNANDAKASGIRDAVAHSPFLIVNGKSSFIKGNGGYGYAARTAIGQRSDGTVLLLVVDSNSTRTKGATMKDLATIMENYGAINAANLDGGTSSVMVENYKIINDPIDSALEHKTRPIATAFVVK